MQCYLLFFFLLFTNDLADGLRTRFCSMRAGALGLTAAAFGTRNDVLLDAR